MTLGLLAITQALEEEHSKPLELVKRQQGQGSEKYAAGTEFGEWGPPPGGNPDGTVNQGADDDSITFPADDDIYFPDEVGEE